MQSRHDYDIQVETKDALLHAINEQYVEAVEVGGIIIIVIIIIIITIKKSSNKFSFFKNFTKVLLDHEESIHVEGELWVSSYLNLVIDF